MLINGWSIRELNIGKYASCKDIGTIKFYIEQIVKYGKVLWCEDEYKIETVGINFDICHNKWIVRHKYDGKRYNIGYYKNLNDALDVHDELEQYLNTGGDFISWYQNFKSQRSHK